MHHFDLYGWYTSEALPGRATDIAPPTTSETTKAGAKRANWLGDGWEVRPYVAPPAYEAPARPVPASVTNAQGSAALIMAGLWTPVLGYVEGIADPVQRALAEVTLHKTAEWRRDNVFLNDAARALKLTDEQIDALFIAASEIVL